MRKYPKAVCTGKSAFYYHSLTDVTPGHYYLATKRTDTRIKDSRVKQSFIKNDIFDAGIIQNYRKISFEMDFGLVEDYAAMFRNGTKLMDMIQMEVLKMNLYEEIEKIKEQGFSEADAQSKLGQDIVLKAISDSGQVGISVSLPCLTAFSTMGCRVSGSTR